MVIWGSADPPALAERLRWSVHFLMISQWPVSDQARGTIDMNAESRLIPRSTLALLLTIALAGAPSAEAQSPAGVAADRLVGAWELVRWTAGTEANLRFPYGEEAQGQISYSANGRMSAHLMQPPEADGEPPARYLSYWGGYSLDGESVTVTHHVIGSNQANFIGWDLVREYTFEEGDLLVLRAGTNRLVWRRVR